MEEEVRDAVFGNVGTTAVFRVGPFDAEVLEPVFFPSFTKEDIASLDKRQIYMTLMIDGVGSAPFSAVTIPPIEAPKVSYRSQIIESSRAQFTAPRTGVESVIIEELAASVAAPAPFDARMKKKPVSRSPVKASEPERIQTPLPVRVPVQPVQPVQEVPVQKEEIKPLPPKPFTARAPVQRPLPPTKSSDDLKAILRTMTTKNGAEKEQKQTQHKESLKGVLSEVLGKSKQQAVSSKPEMPKPVVVEPPQEKKPFEVSEEALRKVLKGES